MTVKDGIVKGAKARPGGLGGICKAFVGIQAEIDRG
jgi:hypothetical protein